MDVINDVWTTASVGRTIAIVGGLVPESPRQWCAHRLDPASSQGSCSVVQDARTRLSEHIDPSLMDKAKAMLGATLRRRVLKDTSESEGVEAFVELVNEAAQHVEQPLALVFDHVDRADEDSLQLLRDLVAWPGRFQAAILLQFDVMPEPDAGPPAELLATVRVVEGPPGLVGTHCGPHTYAELSPATKPSPH